MNAIQDKIPSDPDGISLIFFGLEVVNTPKIEKDIIKDNDT